MRRTALYKKFHLQAALADYEAIRRREPLDCITDHVVNDLLGAQLLVHYSCGLAHQEGPCVVERVVVNVVAHGLHVVLDGDLALARELLDFLLAVVLPVLDVWVCAHAEWTALLMVS